MGRDKAFVPVEGEPMVRRVAATLWSAGAAEVLAIGGDVARLAALGLDARVDPRQGEGPLGGVLTALEIVTGDIAVVVATDLAWLDATAVAALVVALSRRPLAAVAAAVGRAGDDASGDVEPLCAAWRVARTRPVVGAAYDRGERAVRRVLQGLAVVTVSVDAATVRNANTPDDLRR
jgi:molybdopterin-guanine dinucleotide biosynthesis protein A